MTFPYETIPIEKKDAKTVHILTGTVTDIDIHNITVDVDIDDYDSFSDVPVFYHCEDSETADGMPFAINDRVIIVNSGDAETLSIAEMKVVGFEDGLPRYCPFYIRPTFNGFTPTHGGEHIRVEHTDFDDDNPSDHRSESGSISEVTGDWAGLCGPFSGMVATGKEHISVAQTAETGELFHYFVEVPASEAERNWNYAFPVDPNGWDGKTAFNVNPYFPEDNAILHVNYVAWFRHDKLLSECTKTTEIIAGKKYTVYLVPFTELYYLQQTHKVKLSTDTCNGCGPVEITQENQLLVTTIGGIATGRSVGNGYCPGGDTVYSYEILYAHTPEFVLSKEQICILSNEFGRNPSYTPLTINTNMYIKSQVLENDAGTICSISDTDYPNSQEYEYKMMLTPANKF